MYPERAIDPLQFPPKQKVWVVFKFEDGYFSSAQAIAVFSSEEKVQEYYDTNKCDYNYFDIDFEVQ